MIPKKSQVSKKVDKTNTIADNPRKTVKNPKKMSLQEEMAVAAALAADDICKKTESLEPTSATTNYRSIVKKTENDISGESVVHDTVNDSKKALIEMIN